MQAIMVEHRRRPTEAKLNELEHREGGSDNDQQSEVGNSSVVVGSDRSARVKDWVESVTSAGNLDDMTGGQAFPPQVDVTSLLDFARLVAGELASWNVAVQRCSGNQTFTKWTPNFQEAYVASRFCDYTSNELPNSSINTNLSIYLPPPVSAIERTSYPPANTEVISVPPRFAIEPNFVVESSNISRFAAFTVISARQNPALAPSSFPESFSLPQPPFVMPTSWVPPNLPAHCSSSQPVHPMNFVYPPNCPFPRTVPPSDLRIRQTILTFFVPNLTAC